MTCWPPFAAKEQGIGGNPCVCNAQFLAADIMAYAFTKTVIDATMCAIIALSIRDLLDFAGLSSNLAYNERVYRLHRY